MAESACACGAPPHPDSAHRCANGHVTAENQFARTHGVRAFETRGAGTLPGDLRQTVDEFRVQVTLDRGGVEHLTAIEAGYIRRLGELETVARLLASDLAQRGIFTPKGRVRGTFGRWLETLDRWDKFAGRVGADRRARPVQSLREYVAEIGEQR